ncbi:MAG: hypothetical protein E7484_03065 [Ruminococcaceae bacterium]|nr:hypothetical protein [Oscillospiraceae bacterium]
MKKTQLYTLIVLSFCSAQLEFMMKGDFAQLFPRDRIIHTGISVLIFFIILLVISRYSFNSKLINAAAAMLILIRAVYVFIEFINYFHTFHGSNTIAIILFSAVTAVLFYKYICYRTHMLYSFFTMFNITLFVLTVILSADKINVANIYSNSIGFGFSIAKMPVLFDIITICVIADNKKNRMYAGKRFLLFAGCYMFFITLLQGLCIRGNILYSVSPLQALVQTIYTDTIVRYDYIFTIYYTLNYLAAVMLYCWALKQLAIRRNGETNEIF